MEECGRGVCLSDAYCVNYNACSALSIASLLNHGIVF